MATAKSWAHRLAQRDDWVVIDVETTGLGIRAEIVEAAIVSAQGDSILDVLVRPNVPPEPAATQVHGLSADELARAIPFNEVYGTMVQVMEGRVAVAYHAAFDRQALDWTCQVAGLPPIRCTWDCAMLRYEQWRGFRASLRTACEVESILTSAQRHRALTDARLVWRLIRRIAGETR